MLKNAWLFFIIALFVSCSSNRNFTDEQTFSQPVKYVEASMQEQHNAGLWVSGPLNGQMVIIGVSGRLSTGLPSEIEAAKEDAARRVCMYYGIQGSVELTNTTGSGGFFDFSADSKLDLQYDPDYEQYKERLTFDPEKDVFQADGTTFVRFQFSPSDLDVDFSPNMSGSRPAWVNNRDLPEFAGYTTAVGHAGKRSRLKDTIFASCESAAAGLIESASTQVSSGDTSGIGVSSATHLYIKSEGRLMNFQILGFWINPENDSVSTLAIARVSK